ncbi:MAG: hypothetical protein HZA74_04445 [Ignavibacteriales bacterium]|nr:hypothetical protein [Ignavibacteriales bacterium]
MVKVENEINAVEAVHLQFRKVTNARSIFPHSLPTFGWLILSKKCYS